MLITVANWDKFNPRRDLKSTSWLRLQNTFWTDPTFFKLDNDQKMVWISLLCQASQKMTGSIEVDQDLISAVLKIPEKKSCQSFFVA